VGLVPRIRIRIRMREDFFIPDFYNQNRFYTRTRATIKIVSLLRIFIKSFVLRKDERFGIRLYYFPVQYSTMYVPVLCYFLCTFHRIFYSKARGMLRERMLVFSGIIFVIAKV
jgi:hypothetical protein